MKILKKNKSRKLRIFNFWRGNNKDRFALFGIIAGIWLLIKALEELLPNKYLDKLPSDVSLTLLGMMIMLMIFHAIFIFVAQYHRRRNPRELSGSYKPSIDIFISAHNEETVIAATLDRLLQLSYTNLQIYIINDRSQDKTQEIIDSKAKSSNGKIIAINRPQDAFPGKAAALNDALKVSQGEVILVLDADAVIKEGFIENIVAYLDDPLVAAVQAQKVISNPEANLLARQQLHEYAMDTYLQMGRDSIRGSVELRGNGQLIKREALEDVGGWNEETITDDLDLSTCLHVNGWDIRFSPENQVYEEAVTTLDGFIKQRRRWAEGSMRRYLNYFLQLLKPGNLTLNQIFDTLFFLGEFSIPLWLSLDVIYEVIRFANGRETYLTSLMYLSICLTIIIGVSMFNGLRIYKEQKVLEALGNTIVGITYILLSWNLIIMMTYRKILFSRSVGTWARSPKLG
ncbi:MAG: glycosyltransferase family 2 protein [Cyanobacteria bacterium]|nr:glycosyltransferase family 2 protein [Cyanobacteriota bacterium]MDA1020491.1 glycosyltransferase family 2 protein [Cyanobacteriota bacterium]